MAFDLDAYLARIAYTGARAASLDTLAELHLRHPAEIPFENLNPLLRLPVRLDPASLQQKLVHDRRGGYCYEHNLLFAGMLRALGFTVHGLAARVLWNAPDDAVRPRSHMLLRVEVDGRPYIADVGFGGLTLTSPLRLHMDVEQPTPHEPFRLVRAGEDVMMEARVAGAWKRLYRFGFEEHLQPDYEVANWFTSTHPESPFVRVLMAARVVGGTRCTLLNGSLAVHHIDGPSQRRTLTTVSEICDVLETDLGIALPRGADLDAALRAVLTPPPSA